MSRERYLAAFDEINKLTEASFKLSSKDPEQVKDDVLSFLINGYKLGHDSVEEMLEVHTDISTTELRTAIYQQIGGKTFEDRIDDHLREDDLEALIVLTESEFHRVYNAGAEDAAVTADKVIREKDALNGVIHTPGQPVVYKEWLTRLDDRVRETHDYLEGMRVGVNEEFYTYDGDHAKYPGGFQDASNNVNCRCVLSYGREAGI